MIGAIAVALVFCPNVALANAGTPLMWAGMLHLIFGNLGIGIVEGWLLARMFKMKVGRCVPVMIAANYFSAWVGTLLLASLSHSLDLDLYNAWRWLWIMVAATYALTLLLEWPFVSFCLRKTAGWFPKSVWGSLAVQTATYFVLFGWYGLASGTSLFTEVTIVPRSEISLTEGVVLYYISQEDGAVYAWDLREGDPKKIASPGSQTLYDRLLFRKASADSQRWDLVALSYAEVGNQSELRTILPNVTGEAAIPEVNPKDPRGDWWLHRGLVPCLTRGRKGDWEYHFGFWPVEGLRGTNQRDGRRLWAALETPFVAWTVRNAIQLPDDKVLFEYHPSAQICIVDPNRRQIALLVKGRGPAVALLRQVPQLP